MNTTPAKPAAKDCHYCGCPNVSEVYVRAIERCLPMCHVCCTSPQRSRERQRARLLRGEWTGANHVVAVRQ